jgi:hypothetical protein
MFMVFKILVYMKLSVINCNWLLIEADSSHIDMTTGEPLYDTPENFSGSYDHLNLFKARSQSEKPQHTYGIHSGKRLQESTEEGRKYQKKKSRGKGNLFITATYVHIECCIDSTACSGMKISTEQYTLYLS